MTHPPISTLSFTLQLCYTPLGILQRVTKSDKFHISRHEGFPNFVTWNLLNLYARVSKSKERVAGIRPSLAKCYNCQAFGLLFFECRHSPHWHLQETTVSHEGLFDIHFNCTRTHINNKTHICWFIVHICDMKIKQMYHYLELKTAKLYELSTSFQVSFNVCFKKFWKWFCTVV